MKNVEVNKTMKLSEHLASPSEAALSHSSELNGLRLTPHFSLGEVTKSKHADIYNIPSHVAIENLKRVCEWLEELRRRYNLRYVLRSVSPPKLGGVPVWAGWSEEAPDIPSFRPPLAPPNSGGETERSSFPQTYC